MEIRELNKEEYKGKKFEVKYISESYLDVDTSDYGFSFTKRYFMEPQERGFEDELFGEWLDNPIVYGAFEGEELLGFVEGAYEEWNRRFRISNIYVIDTKNRHLGLGGLLLKKMLERAKESGARMAVLETQSCNEAAISFYKKNGFRFIGLDTYAYSNHDKENHEIRLEMGKRLEA